MLRKIAESGEKVSDRKSVNEKWAGNFAGGGKKPITNDTNIHEVRTELVGAASYPVWLTDKGGQGGLETPEGAEAYEVVVLP